MISVIIPVFNAQNTIRRCFDSILHQGYSDYEVIVIDDGSTDNSPAICDEYATKDSRFRVFHRSNGGVSSARNVGLANACGEWITFADADDRLEDNSLSIIAEAVKSVKLGDKTKLILENAYIENQNTGGQRRTVFNSPVLSFRHLYSTSSYGALWNKTFNAEVIRQHNMSFDETMHYCEDCLFVAEYCSYMESVHYVEECCYIQYRPASYQQKYSKYWNFDTFLDIYSKTKNVNPACASARVDGLIMMLMKELPQCSSKQAKDHIRNLKKTVGSDIKHAQGKKKFAIRWLAHINNVHIWSAVLYIYAKLRLVS